jgi:hypothetical protein
MWEAHIRVRLFDGRRLPPHPAAGVLLTIRPQSSSKDRIPGFRRGNDLPFRLPAPEDCGGFAILASAEGYDGAGIAPVKAEANQGEDIHLRLPGRESTFQFVWAAWDRPAQNFNLLYTVT